MYKYLFFWKKTKLNNCLHVLKEPDIWPTVCQGRGNRSNERLRTWQPGQLKERVVFFVSRSLTLPFMIL